MAKTNEPYADNAPSKLRTWAKSRPAKITAIIAGSGIALGAAFSGGVAVGHEFNDGGFRDGFGAGFDRDRDHMRFPGGDQDGDHRMPGGPNGGFKMDDQNMPNNNSTPSTTNP